MTGAALWEFEMKGVSMWRRFGAKVGGLALVALVPGFALAQSTPVTFDPASTLAIVDSAIAFITAVGMAVLGLIMLAKGIRWVRRAG